MSPRLGKKSSPSSQWPSIRPFSFQFSCQFGRDASPLSSQVSCPSNILYVLVRFSLRHRLPPNSPNRNFLFWITSLCPRPVLTITAYSRNLFANSFIYVDTYMLGGPSESSTRMTFSSNFPFHPASARFWDVFALPVGTVVRQQGRQAFGCATNNNIINV